jgi:hypothetical protein
MRRLVVALVIAALTMGMAGCSREAAPTMPDLVGKRLDVAISDVKRAGVRDDVGVQGGGTFGILDKSNWTVCSQEPAAGNTITAAPRITVERTCERGATSKSTADPGGRTAPSTESESEAAQKGDGTNFKFGQTAHFRSTAGSHDIPLEFTVSSPKTFTPSKDATGYDALTVAGAQTGTLKATNIYFTVTVKNASKTQTWDSGFVFGHVRQTGDDVEISEVHDGTIDSTFNLDDIPPGKSATFKDGFSVKSADTIQYELSVDGMAGMSFYWTK